MPVTSCLEIDLTRLEKNFLQVREIVGPAVKICGVVKADGYGLGAVPIARRLAGCGIDLLAVYSPSQALRLEDNGIVCPVMILMPVRIPGEIIGLDKPLAEERLHLTIHDEAQLDQVNALGRQFGCRIPVHLHLDTGMSRGGLDSGQLGLVLDVAPKLDRVRLAGLYTHFAATDDDPGFSEQQMDRLTNSVEQYRSQLPSDLLIHAANTFGILRDSQFHQSMVRVGLGLYGYGPRLMRNEQPSSHLEDLYPVVRWTSQLVHIQSYGQGTVVGYNCTHRLQRDSRLGLVPVGYADGYPLALSGASVVEVLTDSSTRVPAPVLGKVNMDQIIVDLTDVPAMVNVGTSVELISSDPNSPCALEQLAQHANSSCYELLCRLSSRLPRQYLEET